MQPQVALILPISKSPKPVFLNRNSHSPFCPIPISPKSWIVFSKLILGLASGLFSFGSEASLSSAAGVCCCCSASCPAAWAEQTPHTTLIIKTYRLNILVSPHIFWIYVFAPGINHTKKPVGNQDSCYTRASYLLFGRDIEFFRVFCARIRQRGVGFRCP